MNFAPLQSRHPALAGLGEHAEQCFRDNRFDESVRYVHRFAEEALRKALREALKRCGLETDDMTLGAMMRTPPALELLDGRTHERLRRIDELGRSAAQAQAPAAFGLGRSVGKSKPHYRVRTRDDAAECLRYGHAVAVLLMALTDPAFAYPAFCPLAEPRVRKEALRAAPVFNAEQRSVIELTEGRHLVLAPPGCGKTAILAERISHALKSGVKLADMLCLTFTNRAARGMRERIDERFAHEDMSALFVGNLHRFCSRMLFEKGVVPEVSTIIDEDDAHDVISGLVVDGLSKGGSGPALPLEASAYIIARAAQIFQEDNGFPEETRLRTPNFAVTNRNLEILLALGLAKPAGSGIELDHAALDAVARRYLNYKARLRLLDFNDLLLRAWTWLDKEPEDRPRYAWVQVDEVQDLSPLQLDIIAKLRNDAAQDSVCVYFGDEQQAIFSFLGAKLETLKSLAKTHVIHRLHRNFRSPSYLLDMFNVYARRELGCDRAFLPEAEKSVDKPEGALRMMRTATPTTQTALVGELVRKAAPGETTAVIVPSNREADAVSLALKELDIDHFKISGSDIFRQNILKAAKAYLGILKDDFRSAPWAQLAYRLSSKKQLSLKKIRDYFALEFPKRGLLASDLMLYSTHNDGEPVSALEDFMRAYEGELVVFDTETTGLEIGVDEVIQIAALKLRAGKVVDRLVLYLETTREIPKTLGGIPNPMIEEYDAHRGELLAPQAGINAFLDFVGNAPVVGHNVEFDANILNAQYALIKEKLRRTGASGSPRDRDENRVELVRRFDTLKLSHALEPAVLKAAGLQKLPSHKLKDLIAVLGLEGTNSHKADDDVEATVNLMRWMHMQAGPLVSLQRQYLSYPGIVRMSDALRNAVLPLYLEHRTLMHKPMPADDEAILVQVFRQFVETMPNYTDDESEIGNIRKKLPLIYAYLDRMLVDARTQVTLYGQLQHNLVQLNSLKEPDLCSSGIVPDRIFISTVHKAKGLEFDNVIVTSVIKGTYPFFSSHSRDEILEDARKLYVAISRTKRTLVLTMPTASHGYAQEPSPFVNSIANYFEAGDASRH